MFIDEVHTATSRLTAADGITEEFVEKLTFLNEVKEKEASLDMRCAEIQSLYELIDHYKIPVPDIDKAAFATLNPDFQALKNAVEEVESMRDDNIQKYSTDLEGGNYFVKETRSCRNSH